MSSEITQQIKDKIDIVDLISSYIKLQKAGVNYRARCPFHNEKSASFYVTPERAIWHCFGCNIGGDIFSFIQQMEGVEFPEALRILAERAGVKLEKYESNFNNGTSVTDNKETLFQILDASTRFFEKQLWQSNTGKYALEYLRERGMTDDTIKLFKIGYAPQSWDGLSGFLSSSFDQHDIVASGVAIKREKGNGFYDRFRSRIMFPLQDANGRVSGFSGRIFHAPGQAIDKEQSEQEAKYVNTPQTSIYDKSRILYGLDKAKSSMRTNRRCLVVEGNVDVILSQQAGVTNTIATCGTALTDTHISTIKRFVEQVDLCFDSDNAGISATEKAIQLCISHGLKVNALVIDEPEIKDPADYVKAYGDKWVDKVATARPFLEYIYETSRAKLELNNPEGKRKLCERILPYVGLLKSRIERSAWISRLALATRLPIQTIEDEADKVKLILENKTASSIQVYKERDNILNIKLSSLDALEENLITILLFSPVLAKSLKIDEDIFLSEMTKSIINKAIEFEADKHKSLLSYILDNLVNKNNPQVKSLTAMLELLYVKSQELWSDFSQSALESQIDILLKKIRHRDLSTRLQGLEYDIKLAEQDRNKEHLESLISDFSNLSRKLSQVS